MEDDGWDLQAVVKGCCGPAKAPEVTVMADSFSSFPSVIPQEGRGVEEDLLLCFPELFATRTALHELEELCKPFFSKAPQQQQQQQQLQRHQQQLLLSPQSSPSSCSAAPLLPACAAGAAAPPPMPQQQIRQPQHRPVSQNPRSKRRKNQQKRVVCQVPADGLSSDMWAWRKYGQKPIKGSPYPRGYYRCSSSKGCLARKQVERSRTDPGMFVVTYTGEHNHPVPTHRNSLAGSTRQKFPPPSGAAACSSAHQANPPAGGAIDPEQAASSSPLSSPTAAALSPTTPAPTSSMEDELLAPLRPGGPDDEEDEGEEREDDEDLLLVGHMEMLGEEDVMFMDLGEPRNAEHTDAAPSFGDDGLPDHFGAFPPPWMGAATAAGGS